MASCELCCAHCGAADAKFLCSRCHNARYCNAACQRAGWRIHRQSCTEHSAEAVGATSALTGALGQPGTRAAPTDVPSAAEMRQLSLRELIALMESAAVIESEAHAVPACAALYRLIDRAVGNRDAICSIVKAGGVRAVLRLAQHVRSPRFAGQAIQCLHGMAPFADRLHSSPGLAELPEGVATLLRLHAANEHAAAHGFGTFGSLAELSPAAADAVVRAGAISLAVPALQRHASSPFVSAAVCKCLAGVVHKRSSHGGAVETAGLTPLVVDALQRHAAEAVVVEEAARLLWYLCKPSKVRDVSAAVGHGVVRAALAALDALTARGSLDEKAAATWAAMLLSTLLDFPVAVSDACSHGAWGTLRRSLSSTLGRTDGDFAWHLVSSLFRLQPEGYWMDRDEPALGDEEAVDTGFLDAGCIPAVLCSLRALGADHPPLMDSCIVLLMAALGTFDGHPALRVLAEPATTAMLRGLSRSYRQKRDRDMVHKINLLVSEITDACQEEEGDGIGEGSLRAQA